MCGIIGLQGPNNKRTRALLASLLYESSYRGLHSLGLAWAEWGTIQLHQHKNPRAEDLTRNIETLLGHSTLDTLSIIGHLRYATSDPNVGLPIIRDGMAITLNGVISQESPEDWPNPTGAPWQTGNDAEIALRYALLDKIGEHGGSFAIGLLRTSGEQIWVRNGHRPLWTFEHHECRVHCSTRDIARRSAGRPWPVAQEVQRLHWEQPDLQIPTPSVSPCVLR